MNPLVKRILALLLSAFTGSGITIAITDGVSVNCKPIIDGSSSVGNG